MKAENPAVWTPYKRYVIGVLLVVYTFNFIDRQIVAILSPAIKADLDLSDTQLGFLKGFAFALFYATLGIPIARLADKHNRVTIISVALALWSGMTALCGAAANFVQLAAARIGVGVGEAGCSPPIHSLIADYFVKEQRATALSVYALGIPLGTVFGFLAGGWLASELGWRWAFVLVGVPGVLFAVIVKMTIREPQRGAADGAAPAAAEAQTPMWEAAKTLWRDPSYRTLAYGASLASFCGYAIAMWIVDFLFRTHGLSYGDVTVQLAIVMGIGGAIGTYLGGALTDRFAKTNPGSYASTPAWAIVAGLPFLTFAIWTGSPTLSFVAMFPAFLLTAMWYGPFFATVQTIAPLHLRAFASAFFLFIVNAIGFGFGPLLVGVASDVLTPSIGEAAALQWALTGLIPIFALGAVILLRGEKQVAATLSAAPSLATPPEAGDARSAAGDPKPS
ncbi:MAG: MFS transporter [Pseudomonadota bacterium]